MLAIKDPAKDLPTCYIYIYVYMALEVSKLKNVSIWLSGPLHQSKKPSPTGKKLYCNIKGEAAFEIPHRKMKYLLFSH